MTVPMLALNLLALFCAFVLGADIGSRLTFRMLAESTKKARARCDMSTEFGRGWAAALDSVTKAGERAGR